MSRKKTEKTERQRERRRNISEALRGMIFPLIMLALTVSAVFVIMNYQNAPEEEEAVMIHGYTGDGSPVVLESDKLLFTMDPETTQFTVQVKDSGRVWYSNPQNAASDPGALTEEKAKLQSTLLMSYAVNTGLEVSYNTHSYSVDNGIYDIQQGEDFVRVDYSLGNVEKEYIIPPVTTKENFDKWTDAMDSKGRDRAQQYYKKYDINKLGKKDNREELLQSYPILETEVIYVLRDTTKENVKKNLQEFFAAAGYTYEDYLADKELSTLKKSSDKPVFNVSMIYRLEGDDLVVEVPFSSMEYKKDYPIYTVTPLPYFGAGGKEDEGYLLVPEGGGAAIRFNNGKVSQSSYYTNVYGWDMCLGRDAVVHNTRAYYGVYGIANGEDSFICILESGEPYASIQADISGKNHSFNYVNAVYSVSQREKYDVGDIANSDIYRYVEQLPEESLIQRYRFIDSADYVDMAKSYGGYLQDMYGSALALNEEESVPVVVDITGAVDKVKQILGVPVSRPLALTTYQEAKEMVEDLSARGVKNLSVKLSGWCNGGVQQKMLNRIKPISSLGNSEELQALSDTCRKNGIDLYLNGITQYAMDSSLLDGFFSYRDAAKRISKEMAGLKEYSSVTYSERDDLDTYYLLHTKVAEKMADNLEEACGSYHAGVSYADLGMDLSSDFYRKEPYSRLAVKKLQEERLSRLNAEGVKVMINMGNDYAVPFCSVVTGMDLRGSEYTILDECIPFYQLAVHGRVNYTGDPLNICGNTQNEILYSAEYGAGLCFSLMKESAFALQKTLYTEYYGSSYDTWKADLLSIYERYDRELSHTFCQEMTGHRNLSPVLSLTEYADGTKVYVNYGYSDAKEDGVAVPARDYLVVRQAPGSAPDEV